MEHNLLIVKESSKLSKIESIIYANFPHIKLHSILNTNEILHKVNTLMPGIIIFEINNIDTINLNLISDIKKIGNNLIIVVSQFSDLNCLYNAGVDNYIQKPYSEITLISNLRSAMIHLFTIKSRSIKEKENEIKNKKIQDHIENELIQKEIISKKNKEIMADIRYASRIQQAILPGIEFINDNIEEYFILHQPKAHVSGDFYWLSANTDKLILAVGDCTGHGLSGALMHMLGSVYLNEIVTRNNYKTAGSILDQLRDNIMKSLNQTGQSGETQDGLDIALCIIDKKDKTLQYAGANNPIYIIRHNELTEIKGDRMPVGIHINFDKPFTNKTMKLEHGDQLYLFSDGFADQFGGPRGKKFRYKQFKELLININHEPMNIQKEILNNTHDRWRGSFEQIDDILVFGIKIK